MQHLQVVLDAMIEFIKQHSLMRFGLPAVTDVYQHVHGADDIARRIAQRRRVRHEWHQRAIRALCNGFHTPDGAPSLKSDGHWAFH